MKLLNELLKLQEEKNFVNVLGRTLNGILITKDTQNEVWKGDFGSSSADLTSLKYVPKEIEGSFYFQDNALSNLENGPTSVTGSYIVYQNLLTSLKGCPDNIYGRFDISDNPKLTSLKDGPTHVSRIYDAGRCGLTAIDCHDIETERFIAYHNNITSLKDIHKCIISLKGHLYVSNNPLTSHVLGVLLIDGCTGIDMDNKEVQEIVNEYLPNKEGRKGLLKCKGELVDAGFEEFAQL